jgi:hypothetical protein
MSRLISPKTLELERRDLEYGRIRAAAMHLLHAEKYYNSSSFCLVKCDIVNPLEEVGLSQVIFLSNGSCP